MFARLFARSFARSIVRSLVHSFDLSIFGSFIHLLVCSFVQSLFCSFVPLFVIWFPPYNPGQYFVSGICIGVMFLVGLSMVTGPGYYIFQIFDDFSVTIPLLFITLCQSLAIGWVYGADK